MVSAQPQALAGRSRASPRYRRLKPHLPRSVVAHRVVIQPSRRHSEALVLPQPAHLSFGHTVLLDELLRRHRVCPVAFQLPVASLSPDISNGGDYKLVLI
eukprot:COSAG02_NODE_4924_length_4834_cov_2.675818_1_plen_100_part_00